MSETEEEVYYLGKNDRAFKELMLKRSNQDLLKILLESVLDVKIEKIDYEPTERNTGHLKIRRKNLDCLLTTDKGIIGIEVNTSKKKYLPVRNMSFICETYVATTLIGEEYTENINVIQINLSYGLPKSQERKREYMVRDKNGNIFVKNFKIIEINMELYNKKWYDKHKLKMSEEEKLKNLSLVMIGETRENLEELSKENGMVNKYMDELDRINKDPIFRRRIDYEKDQEMIKNSEISMAKEEGLEQGLEEGSNLKSIEIAKNLLKKNMSTKDIVDITGLSEQQVLEFKNGD